MQSLSIDIANHRFKAALTPDAVTACVRSLATQAPQVRMHGVKKETETVVRFNGATVYVGKRGADMRTDRDIFGDAWETRALTYAALAQLLPAGSHDLRIVAGLPVGVLMSGDAATTARKLRAWLQGQHVFTVDDKSYGVNVQKVLARAQPAGAFYEYALDENGTWRLSRQEEEFNFAVVDVGSNTLDLTVMHDAKHVPALSGGAPLGFSWAAKALKDAIYGEYGEAVSLAVANELLEKKASFTTAGNDIIALVDGARNEWLSQVAAEIGRVWPNGENTAAVTLLVGGGARLVKNTVQAMGYRGVTLLDDPVTANARGLAKYARRERVWK
jgi:hypothetical protein